MEAAIVCLLGKEDLQFGNHALVIISIPAKAQTSPYTKVHKASILQKANKESCQ